MPAMWVSQGPKWKLSAEHRELGRNSTFDRLSVEAILRLARRLRGQNLDGDTAFQSRITRAVHLTHSARTQGREDFVGPEFGARSKRHTWPRLYSRAYFKTGYRVVILQWLFLSI
jgi:hypothetical protein